jgi:hypothetical protein
MLLVMTASTFAARARSLNVRRMPLGVVRFFRTDKLAHAGECLLEE